MTASSSSTQRGSETVGVILLMFGVIGLTLNASKEYD